jgi:hypothetical protein
MSAKTSKPSGAKRKRVAKDKGSRRAGRQLLLYFLTLGLLAVGFHLLYTSRGARPLDARGLRVSGEGRSDATHVLSAAHFASTRVRNAYYLAAQIPETLNQLYCWCGCIERGMRSNLECFETTHASVCDVCLAGAEVAWEMRQRGVTDPAKVQQVLDARFGPST